MYMTTMYGRKNIGKKAQNTRKHVRNISGGEAENDRNNQLRDTRDETQNMQYGTARDEANHASDVLFEAQILENLRRLYTEYIATIVARQEEMMDENPVKRPRNE